MAMEKRATFSHKSSIKALNQPKGWEIFNLPNQIKTASAKYAEENEDLNGFDLKTATSEHPDHLYVKIFAIKENEVNDNGDAFSPEELKLATKSFIGVPLFTNHQNDDVEKARGKCVHSWYDSDAGGIFIIGQVDKVAYPKLARGIEEGYITGSSMGCFLGHNRVLMSDGSYKKIKDVRKNDKVITHKGNVRRVKNLQVHKDKTNDLIYKIKVEGLPNEICATKEHPFYVLKEQTKCYITGQDISLPKSMKNKYRRRTKKGVYQQEEYQVSLKSGELDKFDFEWKKSEDLQEGDMVSFPISKEVIDDADATVDRARLIGYFLAEGSYLRYKGEKTAVEFNLCLSKEKDTLGREIIGLLRRVFDTPLEPKIQERPDRDILMIRLYGKDIAKWFFDYCGEYSHKKKINEKCLFWNPEIQKHILATWINGDGTCRNIYDKNGKLYQNISGTTCSEILHNQMRFISSRLGVYSTTEQIKEKAIERGKRPYWNLIFGCKESQKLNNVLGKDRIVEGDYKTSWFRQTDDYIVMPIKKIETEYNKEPVYNIEVEEDHSYIVEGVVVKNCSVEYSLCSVCHNKAATADEFCEHISNRKNKKYSGTIECQYHNSKMNTDEKCPICKSTKKSSSKLQHDKQQIYEHNYGLKFIENSFVVNPACHDCGVSCILHVPEIQKKIGSFASSVDNLIKQSSNLEEDQVDNLIKIGGVEELNLLKDSMGKLELVVKSMLQQKENVSMDYVSELVKAMADLQSTYDELNEMGYARLPSAITAEDTTEATTGEVPQVDALPKPVTPPIPPVSTPGAASSNLDGLGTITTPKQSSRKIKDFSNENQKIITKVSMLTDALNNIIYNLQNEPGLKEIGVDMENSKETKVAAKSEDREVITEKQLDKQSTDLHPRTESTYEGTTESAEQLGGSERSNDTTSDSPQIRSGTYETITEDQLGLNVASVVRFEDTPEVITEKQWKDMSNCICSQVNDDYTATITQDQLKQLLKNHQYVGSYETIIEDQLKNIGMTDGLKRWANKNYSLAVMKVATKAIADTIASYQKSPEEVFKIATTIVDNPEIRNKAALLSIVNALPNKADDRKVIANKSKYFNKIGSKDSSISTIDALTISVAENAQSGMVAEDVFDAIAHGIRSKTVMAKVNNLVKTKLASISESKTIVSKYDSINSAIKALDRPEDGKYRIQATLEDIGVPVTDKVAFCKGVKKFAQNLLEEEEGLIEEENACAVIKLEVGDNGELIIDISAEGEEICPDDIEGLIEGPIEDIETVEEDEMEEMDPMDEENTDEIEEDETEFSMTAKIRDKIVKEAQMLGGEMGGQGGAAQAPGAGASVPGMPAETAPMENLTEEPVADEDMEFEDDAEEPLPPGSVCPACSSKDVDIISGKFKCNNCGSSGVIKVNLEMDNFAGLTPETSEKNEEFEGEGFEMTESGEEDFGAGEMEEMPAVAAMMKITPNMLKKLASENIELGTVSPISGTTNTIKLASGERVCLDTGSKYAIKYKVSNDGKQVWGQWEWTPLVAGVNVKCASCERAKKGFIKALSSVSLTEAAFDSMDIKAKVDTIHKMKKAGLLKAIKTASKDGNIINDYKVAYGGYGEDFPMSQCVEKLARRFGTNAIALSGPCEGKALAECVCSRLKKADVYTDKLAIKVADNWSDCSGDEECVEDQIRNGYSIREAASICETLKIAVASPEDLLADELSNEFDENPEGPDSPDGLPIEEDTMEDDIDPFADDIAESTVTLELPIDLVEQLDKKLDVALGEDPMEEEHHEDADLDNVPDVVEEAEGEIVEEVTPEDLEVGGDMNETKEMSYSTDMEESKGVDEEGVIFEEECEENKEGILDENPEKKVTVNLDPTLAQNNYDYKEAMSMKSRLGKEGKVNMDLSKVLDIITASEKEISQENAQDSSDIGNYSAGEGGSQMGHENETIPSAKKPSVPRNNATMGQESTDLNPQDKPQPKIPSTDATMGHEDEAGLSGGDSRYTGGTDGQGKTQTASVDTDLMHMAGFSSSSEGLSRLAERILNATKLESPEAVAKDKDIQPISGDSTIGKEEKMDASEPNNVKGSGNESQMGHENETLGDRPDSPKDHPDVATGNAQMGQEELDSEKTTKDKGTVIAKTESNSESEAIRVAARMLQAKMIEASNMMAKIQELKTYKPAQIKDIEKAIFAGKKGLDTVADGMTQPVVINEASSEKLAIKEAQANAVDTADELKKNLQSLFRLEQQNMEADNDEQIQLRRLYS